MRYLIADRGKAASYGISTYAHRIKGERVVLNEKEIGPVPGETAEEKAAMIDGRLYTRAELKQALEEEGWDNE